MSTDQTSEMLYDRKEYRNANDCTHQCVGIGLTIMIQPHGVDVASMLNLLKKNVGLVSSEAEEIIELLNKIGEVAGGVIGRDLQKELNDRLRQFGFKIGKGGGIIHARYRICSNCTIRRFQQKSAMQGKWGHGTEVSWNRFSSTAESTRIESAGDF